ncbi:MAG TPA: hypothetical protein VL485_05575 [Ktedonobacteraceae bacterium]|nr:hypothetical protein [Ktedonobacteraceae bacterium]
MCVSSFFSSRWRMLLLQLGVLVIIILQLAVWGVEGAHAAWGEGSSHAVRGVRSAHTTREIRSHPTRKVSSSHITRGVKSAHVVVRQAHFDIKPIFYPYYEMTPRTTFLYTTRPGALIRDSLYVKNNGTARGTVTLYSADAFTGQSSGEAFFMRTDLQRNVGTWITLSKHRVTLNPGQSTTIPFTLRIPHHVRPGQHAGGLVAEEPIQKQSSTQGLYRATVRLHTREVLGILINLPGKITEKLNATGIIYNKTSTYQSVLVGLSNTGTQLLRPSGRLRIMDQGGRLLQNVPMKLDTILPWTVIRYPVYMHRHALHPGTYYATLTLAYGHKHTMHYATSFDVPFPPLPINIPAAKVISDLVTPDTNFFALLTPWHYAVGITILFFLLSGLFLWSQKAYASTTSWRKKLGGKQAKKDGKQVPVLHHNGNGIHDLQPIKVSGKAKKEKKEALVESQAHPNNTRQHPPK